jgi:small subunit ribosomal protein S5
MVETVTKDTRSNTRRRRTFGAGGQDASQYDHEVLDIARVVRVVKGGRRFRFQAVVVVGDRAGRVGLGLGKSKDIQQAIQKAQGQAEKKMVKINLKDGTITHSAMIGYKGAKVLVKPARPGTGVIAGGTARTIADLAGIKDLVSKRYGSNNKITNAVAAIKALSSPIGAREGKK